MPGLTHLYKIGDHVVVRTWDTMMEEYGPDPYGDIAVHPDKLSFVLGMKPYCGKEFVITKIEHTSDLPDEPIYRLDIPRDYPPHHTYNGSPYSWAFTAAMLLPTTRLNDFASPTIPIPSVSFDDLLQGVQ